MACILKVDLEKHKALKELSDYCGTNTTQFINYVSAVVHPINQMGDIDFTDDFKKEWKKKEELNLSTTNPVVLKDSILKYFKKRFLSTEDSNRKQKDDKISLFGYTSVNAREEAKSRFAEQMKRGYYLNLAREHKVTKNVTGTYIKYAIKQFNSSLASRLSKLTGEHTDVIKEQLNAGNINYVTELVKGKNLTIQLQNFIAFFKEYTMQDIYTATGENNTSGVEMSNPSVEFFTEVLRSQILSELRLKEDNESEVSQAELENQQALINTEGDLASQIKINESDNTIGDLNNKHGIYDDFMEHIDVKLRSLLGSLYKRKSVDPTNTTTTLDTDNELGIPGCMDPNFCCSILYHYGEYDNHAVMLDSIKKIYTTVPGCEAFSDLYDKLNKDINLLYTFYRTFKKFSVSKSETTVEDGVVRFRISNATNNRHEILHYKLLNSFKSSALNNDDSYNAKQLIALKNKINGYNYDTDTDKKQVRNIADAIAEALTSFYSGFDNLNIRNYILLHQNEGVTSEKDNINANIRYLIGELENTVKFAKDTLTAYYEKQSRINAAYRKNSELKRKAKDSNKTPKLIDLTPLYSMKYISSEAEGVCIRLANQLADYTAVATPCNSKNVEGHQASDVINNNMLVSIMNTLQSQLNTYTTDKKGELHWNENSPLVKLGEHRSMSAQYTFSNILLEQVDPDNPNRILNKGLFKRDKNGKWIPTAYAKDLLKVTLYNGASNRDNDSNVPYDKMSHSDYLRSIWENFFNTDNNDTAGYLMRVPSDAPNQYSLIAPRYSAKNLLVEGNLKEINEEINNMISSLTKHQYENLDDVKFIKQPQKVSENSSTQNDTAAFVRHLQSTPEHTVNIRLADRIKKELKANKEKPIKIGFRFDAGESERTENIYIMEGYYYGGQLHDAHFVGFKKDSVNPEMWDAVRRKIIDNKRRLSPDQGGIRWDINTKDALFKQLRNVFYQEIKDMLTAGKVMFKTITVDGKTYFTLNNGEPIMNNGWSNENQNGLHPTYHFKEGDTKADRKIYKNNNGHIELLGKVFHSDRFIIYDDATESEKNYGEEILKRIFGHIEGVDSNGKENWITDFFYGGAKTNPIFYNEATGEVEFNDKQNQIIDSYLKEFIVNYIEQAREEMLNIHKNDKNKTFDSNELAEFVLNYHLMYINFGDLFEGDTKFYKNSQTFLKRAKEVQGSGVQYGMVDITRDIHSAHTPIASPLDNVVFFGGKQVPMFDSFSGVTIYNTIKTDNLMIDCMVKTLTDKNKMGDKVLTEEEAKALMKGYSDTTVNDAQSYITFDEWIRRITGRGQLNKYKPLIDRILDESQPINVEDIKEFVQVQKNFYYDQYYNATTQVISPRQIKNAEFVLIPRFIRGTELEKVAQLMEKMEIDQLNTVETSKSGQGTRFTIWDETGNLTDEIKEDFEHLDEFGKKYTKAQLNKMKKEGKSPYQFKSELIKAKDSPLTKEYFNYNYLYTQQETPQHLGIEAENKAGIQFMKKILDNVDENAPAHLIKAKKQFQKLYSANIKYGYEKLIERLKIATKNGKIQIENGEIVGFDKAEVYKMFEEEMIRQKMDSNTLDYCTLDENGNPLMPNCMSIFGAKFENIVQSIFNRNITRQTLPGFHAAQVSGIGLKTFSDVVDKGKTSNKLNYHISVNETNGEYEFTEYAEIMLPASALGVDRNSDHYKNMTTEEILAELHDKGLDTLIGYRIPTEGKQSIAYMKVVDFTDDAQGSTIIVPDAWVSQTGADFDIDSVYGIQYKTYKTKTGEVYKVDYKHSFNEYDWMNYVARNAKTRIDGITDESYNKAKEDAKSETKAAIQEERQSVWEEFKKRADAINEKYSKLEQDAWDALDGETRGGIIALHKQLDSNYGKEPSRDKYLAQLYFEREYCSQQLDTHKDDYTKEELHAIDNYGSIRIKIYEEITNNPFDKRYTLDYSTLKSEKLEDKLEEIKRNQLESYKLLAKANGLESLETWLHNANNNPIEYNSNDARTNELIKQAVTILTDPYCLEENLSRSNFDDVSDALKKYNASNKIAKAKRDSRSPYNIFSQAWYQEDAMSGLKLKGLSVVRDTLCSVMNTVKPTVAENARIKVFYNNTYDENTLINRFGADNVEPVENGFIVTHSTFGWTSDNKNIDGKILTSYSSQTTAHILDAMKYGNVPNVNDMTFQIYKTFVDMGSNYDTAVSFIMQPGIAKIVEAYNNSNSIYNNDNNSDHIKTAIRMIADELNVEYEYNTTTEELLNNIQNIYGEVAKTLFGEDYIFSSSEYVNSLMVLNSDMNGQRIAEEGTFRGDNSSPVEDMDIKIGDNPLTVGELKSLYDLGIILQYSKINMLVDDIRTLAMNSNPDKFGAKQTIYATRQVFENIIDSIKSTEQEDENGNATTSFRLQKNGEHIFNRLYPNLYKRGDTSDDVINNIMNNDNFVENSDYPFLAAFLKYSTVPSIVVNSTLFATQKEAFRRHIEDKDFGLASVPSNNNKLKEAVIKDYQSYFINYITLKSKFLQAPLKYNLGKGRARGFEYSNYVSGQFNQEESDRIMGYGYPTDIAYVNVTTEDGIVTREEIPFTTDNPFDPSNQTDLDNFAKLTPAQKILWIKKTFIGGAPLFDCVDVNIYDESAIKNGTGCQTLKFDETKADPETVYRWFTYAYTNKNPFVAMATADLVKYAFFAEGFKIGIGNISKMVSNAILRDDSRIYGTGIVNDLTNNLELLEDYVAAAGETLIDRYVRGHYRNLGIGYHKVKYNRKTKLFELTKQGNGLIILNPNLEVQREQAAKYGIYFEDKNSRAKDNKYVRLDFNGNEILYKIVVKEHNGSAYWCLVPLNKLAANENKEWSSIDSNHQFEDFAYYDEILDKYFAKVDELGRSTTAYHPEIMKDVVKTVDVSEHMSPINKLKKSVSSIPIKNLFYADGSVNPVYGQLVDNIREWYATSIQDNKPIGYVWNRPLGKNIKALTRDGELIENIILPNNGFITVSLMKAQAITDNKAKKCPIYERLIKNYTGTHIERDIATSDRKYADLIAILRKASESFEGNQLPIWFDEIYAVQEINSLITDSSLNVHGEQENDDDAMFSTRVDVAVQAGKSISIIAQSDNNDTLANTISNTFRDKGIIFDKDEIGEFTDDVVISASKYVDALVERTINKYENYLKNPDGEGYLPINHDLVIAAIKKDPKLRRTFYEDILEKDRIINQFSLIKDLDISSEDPVLKQYLEKFKKAISKLEQVSIVTDACEKMMKEYFDKLSTNPLIEQGMMSVLDGFYKTNWLLATFNDIQETSNPIVQLALKNFQADYRSKTMTARNEARDFVKRIREIEAEAKANGQTVDYSKFIDEYGRFKQEFNDDFIKDRNELMNAHNEALAVYGRGSIQELETRLAYDEWKAKYVEQPVVSSYYKQKNAILRKMLYGEKEIDPITNKEVTRGKAPEILSLYERIRQQMRNERNKYQGDMENPEVDAKLDELQGELNALRSQYIYLGNYMTQQKIDIPTFNSETATQEEKDNFAKHSLTQAMLLDGYIKQMQQLDEAFFKYNPTTNFEDLVNDNLSIVASYETSDKPISLYKDDENYKRAKTWLRKNANIRPLLTDKEKAEIEWANEVFTAREQGGQMPRLRAARNNKEYRNSEGVFDPSLIPAEEMAKIKEEEIKVNRYYGTTLSDRVLLSNGNPDETIYSEDFYKRLTGSTSSKRNVEWLKTVKELNDILSTCYDEFTKEIDFSKIPHTEEGVKTLRTLKNLYYKLSSIRTGNGNKRVAKFIEENVDSKAINKTKYNLDVAWAKGLPKGQYKTLVMSIINMTKDGESQPNRYLYGIFKPKAELIEKYTDKEKTKAIKIRKKYYETKILPEYYEAKRQARLNDKSEDKHVYAQWLEANTVYNPYSHQVEPLQIWTRHELKHSDKLDITPKFPQQVRIPRDGTFTQSEIDREIAALPSEHSGDPDEYWENRDYRNPNYNPNGGHLGNYKNRVDNRYDSNNTETLNDYEKQVRDLMQNTLDGYVKTKEGKRWIRKGWLPSRAIQKPSDAKGWIRELLKTVGVTNETYDPKDWYDDVDYSKDKPRTMPMLNILKVKGYKDKPKKPIRKATETDSEFEQRMNDYKEELAEIEQNNMELHKNNLDTNWVNVMEDFIVQAATYNAIQDNKYELFFAKKMIEKYGHYILTYNKYGSTYFKKDYETSGSVTKNYARTQDKNLIEQFDNTIRRLVYDQWKAPNNPKLMKWMSTLQSLTSAQYMMFNIKGGIANATLGGYAMIQEYAAKQFVSPKEYRKGISMYGSCLIDCMQHAITGTNTTVGGAIISTMDVIDYDEHTGVSNWSKDAYEILRKSRNAGYTPQTAGEHEMQNRMMFSLMYSHRLIKDTSRTDLGRPVYKFQNFAEYTRSAREKALLAILTEEEAETYNTFKENVKKDANDFKDYAYFSKDVVSEFAQTFLSYDRQKKFAKELKEIEKDLKEEFENDETHPTIISQLDKDENGIMTFKQGSILEQLNDNKNSDGLSDAYALLGEFKGRVISINKYIHGVYDKSGKAQIEKTWIGSLLMQYHKHLPMGIIKRYRIRGAYNEERGAVQKGMYRSLYDFLSIPFKKHKDILRLTDQEVDTLNSVKSVLQNVVDFALHCNVAYDVLPEYDKANLRRLACSTLEVLSTIFATIAIKAGWDDEDSLLYNMALYQADRLGTESAQYFPLTAWGEGRKLWQSPVAAGSGITDMLSSANMIAHMILDGDDYDGEYKSGKFAGENKLWVYIQRRIPIWRGIKSSFIDVKDNNKFYKVSENMIGFIDADKRAKQLRNLFK